MNDEQTTQTPNPSEDDVQQTSSCEACAQAQDGWKRALADYDYLRKDLARERTRARELATTHAAEALLPVLDNFDQAARFVPEGLDAKLQNWLTGMLHVRSQMEEVVKQLGAEPFGAIGDVVDAHKHVTAKAEHNEQRPDQTVLEVIQRGWKIGETVLRPATVVVNDRSVTSDADSAAS